MANAKSLLEEIGATFDDESVATLPFAALEVESLFGEAPEDVASISLFSKDAFGFTAPPELAAIGPLWIAGLEKAAQVRSAIRDAHRRLQATIDADNARLVAFGFEPAIKAPLPQARGTGVVAGHSLVVTIEGEVLHLIRADGTPVPDEHRRVIDKTKSADAEQVQKELGLKIKALLDAKVLKSGKGLFSVGTVRATAPLSDSGDADDVLPAPSDALAAKEDEVKPAAEGTKKKAVRPRRKSRLKSQSAEAQSRLESPEPKSSQANAPAESASAVEPTNGSASMSALGLNADDLLSSSESEDESVDDAQAVRDQQADAQLPPVISNAADVVSEEDASEADPKDPAPGTAGDDAVAAPAGADEATPEPSSEESGQERDSSKESGASKRKRKRVAALLQSDAIPSATEVVDLDLDSSEESSVDERAAAVDGQSDEGGANAVEDGVSSDGVPPEGGAAGEARVPVAASEDDANAAGEEKESGKASGTPDMAEIWSSAKSASEIGAEPVLASDAQGDVDVARTAAVEFSPTPSLVRSDSASDSVGDAADRPTKSARDVAEDPSLAEDASPDASASAEDGAADGSASSEEAASPDVRASSEDASSPDASASAEDAPADARASSEEAPSADARASSEEAPSPSASASAEDAVADASASAEDAVPNASPSLNLDAENEDGTAKGGTPSGSVAAKSDKAEDAADGFDVSPGSAQLPSAHDAKTRMVSQFSISGANGESGFGSEIETRASESLVASAVKSRRKNGEEEKEPAKLGPDTSQVDEDELEQAARAAAAEAEIESGDHSQLDEDALVAAALAEEADAPALADGASQKRDSEPPSDLAEDQSGESFDVDLEVDLSSMDEAADLGPPGDLRDDDDDLSQPTGEISPQFDDGIADDDTELRPARAPVVAQRKDVDGRKDAFVPVLDRPTESIPDMSSPLQNLASIVGEGISTGKTGAIALDAEAFAALRGEVSSEDDRVREEVLALRKDADEFEARARELRDKADRLERSLVKEVKPDKPARSLAERVRKTRDEGKRPARDVVADLVEDAVSLSAVEAALVDTPGVESTVLAPVQNFSSLALQDDADDSVFGHSPDAEGPASGGDVDDGGFSESDVNATRVGGPSIVDAVHEKQSAAAAKRSTSSEKKKKRPPEAKDDLAVPEVALVVSDVRVQAPLEEFLRRHLTTFSFHTSIDDVKAEYLVFVHPSKDEGVIDSIASLGATPTAPRILVLSNDDSWAQVAGVDHCVALGARASEVAAQVLTGLKDLAFPLPPEQQAS